MNDPEPDHSGIFMVGLMWATISGFLSLMVYENTGATVLEAAAIGLPSVPLFVVATYGLGRVGLALLRAFPKAGDSA